jgi:hypothetical protein
MAYIDKLTKMRRMALITDGVGNIKWEGVNIEGVCVLKHVGTGALLVKSEKEIKKFCKADYDYPLFLKYQDKKTDEFWEPRNKNEAEK